MTDEQPLQFVRWAPTVFAELDRRQEQRMKAQQPAPDIGPQGPRFAGGA